MSLYDSDRRYRKRMWGGVFRVFLFVGCCIAAAVFGYEFGAGDLQTERQVHDVQITEYEQERGRLEQENADLRVAAEQAKLAVEEWRRRYEQDAPTGLRQEMLALVDARLADGLDPERLSFLIQAAEEPRDCEGVETKRFLVRTPIYEGANTSVSFAGETVTVTGDGTSEKTEAGLPQAWYDPAAPVTVSFIRIDGAVSEVTGILPLQQSVFHDGVEHRFLVRAGARGFAQVAAERCAYP